jgi:pimeloyl-ACP methyl ester carboxylesterase
VADGAPSGERLCDVGRGITLCYQTFGDPADPPLLLIQGLGMQMIAWPDDLCAQLEAHGFYVVRFDNRDAGRSTHIPGRPPTVGQLIRRRIDPVHYRLADMAQDAAGLIRALDLGPTHVVGVSMGGMIAQTLAAEHPELVRSLTSIMSTTGNRWKGQPALKFMRFLLRPTPADRQGYVTHITQVFAAIGSKGLPQDTERMRDLAGRSYDRDHDREASGRQLGAIIASGDRTDELRRIVAPTLVIHGTDDRLVRPSGGLATTSAIRGARLMLIDGMGHDLPAAAWPELVPAIAEHAHAADRLPAAA